ncbi:MAG: transposase [Actinobacteria bacterium]|nr:transposase [Actinomycetota bacterium]
MNEPSVESSASLQPKRRRRFRPAEKAEWVQRFLEADQSQQQFCQEHGVAQSTLQRWLTEHRAPAATPVAQPAGPLFTEVSLPAALPSSAWVAELARPSGSVLRLGPAVPAPLLEQLLRVC